MSEYAYGHPYHDPLRPQFSNREAVYNPGGRARKAEEAWDWPMKLLAFVFLLEYVFVRPWIIRPDGRVDFIGFVLCYSVLGFLGKLSVKDMSGPHLEAALRNAALGGVVGYAWLIFYVPWESRADSHLLVANLMMLAGVWCGTWAQRHIKRGTLGRTGAGKRL